MIKNVIVGLGEIGKPLFQLISKQTIVVGYDINPKLIDKKKLSKYEKTKTSFLHLCIPYTKHFNQNVLSLYEKFSPEAIVIHSTISPSTTESLQKQLPIPVIYSPVRGVHRRMLHDLKRYTKFYAIDSKAPNGVKIANNFSKLMRKCGIKTKKISNPITLELAKIICDTSYLGWLVNYAQISNMIAIQHRVNYDEMWSFSDEIHKFLGNRPKMYPGFIGGHCVIPNLDLIHNQTLNLIKTLNDTYAKNLKMRKTVLNRINLIKS